MEIDIMGIKRSAICNGDGTMWVCAENVDGTDYMGYDRACDCDECKAEQQGRQ